MAVTWPLSTAYADGDVYQAADVNQTNENVNALGNVVINAQTGTTYTLASTDSAKLVTLSNASAITLTVPPNSSVAFPVGTQIVIGQLGAGQTTIAAGAGVTLRSYDSRLKLTGQYAVASIIKIATDTWLVAGNVSA